MGTITGLIVGIVGTLLLTEFLKQRAEAQEGPLITEGTGSNEVNINLNDTNIATLFF